MKRLLALLSIWLTCCCLIVVPVSAQTAWKPFENFDFSHQKLMRPQLTPLTLLDLKYLRGILFGRHGRQFDEAKIQDFLKTRPWYHPNAAYRVANLNATERENMDLIKEAEWKRHSHVEPGDLKFYKHHVLTAQEFGPHSSLEWRIMAAEIEARHGKTFTDQPWLQEYFEERYWYHASVRYDPHTLSSAEHANLVTIQRHLKQQRRLALAPGDMGLFSKSPISQDMLRGLSLYDLRLLRNEVYARHGYPFHTQWLTDYFSGQSWYQPRSDFTAVTLSLMEHKNIAQILTAEAALHQKLTTTPISMSLLDGLSGDDARRLRNEIYARHGKVFHDHWLNSYFCSLPWYKPDSRFRETSLTQAERGNVALILTYENKARSQLMQSAA